MQTMKKTLPTVIIIIFVGVGAFFAGTKFSQNSSSLTVENRQRMIPGANFDSGQMPGADRLNRASANMVNGEIINKDEESITLKLTDGGSKIIFFSDSTNFTRLAESSITDFNAGEQVNIVGTENDDGSVTAQSIQMRPEIFLKNNSQP